MITLYGHTYAPNKSAVLESLFSGPVTHCGTYRKTRAGVFLSDLQGRERVFIRKDGLGPVSVFVDGDGKRRFMFSTSCVDDAWLGTPDSYGATREGAQIVARALFGA
jgi:hypothetical protein